MTMNDKNISKVVRFSVIATLILSMVCYFVNIFTSVTVLIFGSMLTVLFYINMKKRYERLQELNRYLELVCSGHYDLNIADNTEGELSILQNNLYKIIVRLQSQNEMLKKDKLSLADSLADISHQLKTPLTSMMVMADLLKEESNDKNSEFITIIENQLEKMKWLISNLLKLSKLDAGTAKFDHEEIYLKEIIDESVKPFLIIMDIKNITLDIDVKNYRIKGDRNWSIEAFGNIIKNCVEHMEDNGTLMIMTENTSIYTAVRIIDDGCGIAKEDLPHIFERFYHGKNASEDSVGIGLALSKTIFEKEKGRISVSSVEGQGTTFEVRFYKAVV